MIQTVHPLPKTRRCELLKFPRSSSYYQTKPVPEADQALMKLIDQIHTAKPFLGSRRIVDYRLGRCMTPVTRYRSNCR